jgi:colicin import membrane protein
VAALLIALAVSASSAWADSAPSAEQQADWARRLEKASALQAEGKALKEAADALHTEQAKACAEKFRVNACRDEVGLNHIRSVNEARRVENEGKALERQVKKEKLNDKDARYEAEADERAAERAKREATTAATRQQAADKESSQLTNKAAQAEEGRQRRAADAERLAKKQAEHQARVDQQMAKAKAKAQPPAAVGAEH